ncbi:MAG: HEPN domain-containing protein, partial [Thermomicrobiales bacterium]
MSDVIDRGSVYLEKAEESVAGAQSALANGRYNNCANRAYYACYQAAIPALMEAGIRPPKETGKWGHGFVQARFNGDLINRRKRYPPDLRDVLESTFRLRATADYNRQHHVTEAQAARA